MQFFTKTSPVTWSKIGHGPAVWTGFALGASFGLGIGIVLLSENWVDFGLYLILHGFYHMWEYTYVSLFHPGELSWNSFLINHGKEFYIAWSICYSEYFIERFLFPGLKANTIPVIIGFTIALMGQSIRTIAMITAGSNFHHLVREEKEKNHKLVTVGIYHYLRHPSYFGWFWWSVFLQVLLANPISLIFWGYAGWRFFSERIADEEEALINIFGDDYRRYRETVPIGIPFIK